MLFIGFSDVFSVDCYYATDSAMLQPVLSVRFSKVSLLLILVISDLVSAKGMKGEVLKVLKEVI